MTANSLSGSLAGALGVLIFFVAVWCATSYLIGLASGWRMLGRRFQRQSEPYGEAKTAGPFFTRFTCEAGGAITTA